MSISTTAESPDNAGQVSRVLAGLLACQLLIPVRGQEICQKQAGAPGSVVSQKFMCVILALVGLAALPLTSVHGNPIAVDIQRRPATMTAEAVTITVGQKYSTVSGRFTFQQGSDDWPEERDTHVLVYVPVLLSRGTTEQYEKQCGLPVVVAKGRTFPASIRNDLAFEDSPTGVPLPRGWGMQVYEAQVPLALISKTFEIDVRYIQPNFPGRIAGYVPIRPPKDSGKAKVTFLPIEGHSLRSVGFLSVFAPKKDRFEFLPQDRKLIIVRLETK